MTSVQGINHAQNLNLHNTRTRCEEFLHGTDKSLTLTFLGKQHRNPIQQGPLRFRSKTQFKNAIARIKYSVHSRRHVAPKQDGVHLVDYICERGNAARYDHQLDVERRRCKCPAVREKHRDGNYKQVVAVIEQFKALPANAGMREN